MCQRPLAAGHADFLNLTVATSDKQALTVDSTTNNSVRSEGHGSAEHPLRDAKEADLTTCRAR